MANSSSRRPEEYGTSGSRFSTEGTGHSQQGSSTLTEKAKDVASSVTGKAQEFASSLGQRAEDMGSALGQRAGDAASAVAETWNAGTRYVQEQGFSGMADDVTNLIRRNPIPALLIAFGLGFLSARTIRNL